MQTHIYIKNAEWCLFNPDTAIFIIKPLSLGSDHKILVVHQYYCSLNQTDCSVALL